MEFVSYHFVSKLSLFQFNIFRWLKLELSTVKMDFQNLPNELVIQIFSQPQIEVKDLYNLTVCCKQFHGSIQESNELWRQKFSKL